MRRQLLIGTNNAKKRTELSSILEGLDFEILIPSDLGGIPAPEENGATFEENAVSKALHYSAASGMTALADDSGLVVDALDGAPGVHSSRYAGESATDLDNCLRLLSALEKFDDPMRTARFVCTVVVAAKGKVVGKSTGSCEGKMLRSMRGDRGFGYDPLFFYPPEG